MTQQQPYNNTVRLLEAIVSVAFKFCCSFLVPELKAHFVKLFHVSSILVPKVKQKIFIFDKFDNKEYLTCLSPLRLPLHLALFFASFKTVMAVLTRPSIILVRLCVSWEGPENGRFLKFGPLLGA